jgi:hypothetical protein
MGLEPETAITFCAAKFSAEIKMKTAYAEYRRYRHSREGIACWGRKVRRLMNETLVEQGCKLMHYLTGDEIKMATQSSKNEQIVMREMVQRESQREMHAFLA